MKGREVFAAWAPAGCIWSRWAKPVLFANLGPDMPAPVGLPDPEAADIGWAPGPERRFALVLDMPGTEAVAVGAALAVQRGYCPVPLFNASSGPDPVVDVLPMMLRLACFAAALTSARIPKDAPPAFLLDRRRFGRESYPLPGRFDNRWMVFPQDFPSANLLLSEKIHEIWLVQSNPGRPEHDLLHVLRRWQEAGIKLTGCDPYTGSQPLSLSVSAPNRFRALWYRAMVMTGFGRSGAGGFGAVVPMPSSSGGYG
jgi:hypothetical protein